MDAYVAAKARIFQALGGHGTKVLNADDLTFQHYNTIPSEQTIAYSPAKQLKNIRANATESRATLTLNGQPYELTLGIPGAHNLANALCAMSAAMAIGIDPKNAAQALQSFRGAGGRMERIEAGQPFTVFVDFTVTPAAYLHTLSSARTIAGQHRLLVLTGSCGDRMPEKRPEVGALCARFADIVAVTNEDPYSENPEKIIDEVLAGIPQTFPRFIGQEARIQAATLPARYCIRISDRLETIRFLFREAKPGDVVLLCGKGTDVTMMTARGQIPWNEREIAFRELQTLGNASS
jgi:UDP-N-acetylmuramoyl-L-alanyl-D-glutamate--2,6-diaminopimelate ligase